MGGVTINCGFNRVIREKGKRKRVEHKNVAGIVLDDLTPDSPGQEVRQQLMRHAPEGEGWMITGYYFKD
jgi:5S rRNA maturation endonuclease (ribonuclease M5)